LARAFTRAVSPHLADCALTHVSRAPIDTALAGEQHAAYEEALRAAGFDVVRLPELADHPDGVFVEDTALLLDGLAVIMRPGAASRAAEVESTTAGLDEHFDVHRITSGHLDGGDVLRVGRKLYVGLSSRTDRKGIASLERLVSGFGFEVVAAELRNCLHLKSAATLAGPDAAGRPVLLYNRNSVDPGQFTGVDAVAVNPSEPTAANVVRAGDRVIMPTGYPRTRAVLDARGFDIIETEVSELEKAEAGVTCMSLIDADGRFVD
jgi:dimethylargininase